jgi:glycyl-tRNA synthetase
MEHLLVSVDLQAAMVDTWRKHFVLTESMLEMECTNLTPECVLKTSGHVDRFTDLMVKDVGTGECFRGDKLLEDIIDQLLESEEGKALSTEDRDNHLRVQRQADAYTAEELDELLIKYYAKTPSGQPFSKAFPFNLMFKTSIGPEGNSVGFLRPETAQGLFVNFKRLLDYNAQKMPFAAAQIGYGFRNEIAPRAGLLRVREFCMAEIEHFVDPSDKSHPSFPDVKDKALKLFGRENQLGSGKTFTLPIGEAVSSGLVNNETLGYFMARTQLFMEKIGLNPEKLRFRQHLTTEMAHYATDCWDLEILTSYGWIECVGHADRACYDLEVHARDTKTPMLATLKLDTPKDITFAKLKFDRKLLGQAFKKDQRVVSGALESLAENWDDFEPIATALEAKGEAEVDGFKVTKEMLSWTKNTKKVYEVKFTPSVIEPSFGMGRILHALLEHSFYTRDGDEQRVVMRFNPRVAPNKVVVLPISSGNETSDVVDAIAADFMDSDISTRVDKSSASLGRRYSRADEIGVPFAVTVDFDTLKDNTVTLRDRDTCLQLRVPRDDLTPLLLSFVHGKMNWEKASSKYPTVQVDEDGDGSKKAGDLNAKTVMEVTSRGRFSRPAQPVL